MTCIASTATSVTLEQPIISKDYGRQLGLHCGKIHRQIQFWTWQHQNPNASKSRSDFFFQVFCNEQDRFERLGYEKPQKFDRFVSLVPPKL